MNLSSTHLDESFREAGELHLPSVDWRWIKAQAFQESRFDPKAVSPAGAQGIMQIMPATWVDLVKQGRAFGSPFDAEDSIDAGVWYLSSLYNQWTAPRPAVDRLALAFASYNAGLGNILQAQRNAGGANSYNRIIKGLKAVTGPDNAHETTTYVERIFNYFTDLVLQ